MSAHNAPDGLAEVMGLIAKADDSFLRDRAPLLEAAGSAAVNYLRKHGEAIRELVAAVKCAVDLTPADQRAEWVCHKGLTTADKCVRCSRELRVIAALAQLSDTGRKPE